MRLVNNLTDHQDMLFAMQPLLNRLRRLLDRVFQGALPDDRHAPAERTKRLQLSPVAIDIAPELPLPEFFISPGDGRVAAPFMPMPEAAVDEHNRAVLREHKVRGAGQLSDMKSIAKSLGEEKGAKGSFRPSVDSANARHHAAALRGGRDAHGLGGIPPEFLHQPPLRTSVSQSDRGEATSGRLACS